MLCHVRGERLNWSSQLERESVCMCVHRRAREHASKGASERQSTWSEREGACTGERERARARSAKRGRTPRELKASGRLANLDF